MKKEMIVSVFGSSRPRENDSDYAEARELGRALAQKGVAICTGAYSGTMEAVSRGAKEAGGKTYGVTAEFFPAAKANEWVDVEVRIKKGQRRLVEIIRLGGGFVTLNCVRGVEVGQENPWAEGKAHILQIVATPDEAAEFLRNSLEKEM